LIRAARGEIERLRACEPFCGRVTRIGLSCLWFVVMSLTLLLQKTNRRRGAHAALVLASNAAARAVRPRPARPRRDADIARAARSRGPRWPIYNYCRYLQPNLSPEV